MDNNKSHSSRTIMWITVAVAAVLILIVWPLSMIGKVPADASGDEAELRIQPVARVEMQKAAPPSDGKPRSGETVYNTICQACHAAGVAGAPKTGDKAAWAARIATGAEALLKSATNGKNAMPARGGGNLTDEELKNLDMPAMKMVFQVAEPDMLDDLSEDQPAPEDGPEMLSPWKTARGQYQTDPSDPALDAFFLTRLRKLS